MCIRDRYIYGQTPLSEEEKKGLLIKTISTRGDLDEFEQLNIEEAKVWLLKTKLALDRICLLYTSDAADERSSVDLGGRRILQKKNTKQKKTKNTKKNKQVQLQIPQ